MHDLRDLTHKKSAGILTCCSSRVLRLSHCPIELNEQRRSPRWLYVNIHIPKWTSTVAVFRLYPRFARFQNVKNIAPCKRLLCICPTRPASAPRRLFLPRLLQLSWLRRDKNSKFRWNDKEKTRKKVSKG